MVTDAVALSDPLDAVIVAEPLATAVIVPPDTVATSVSFEDQFTVGWLANAWPSASRTVAVTEVVAPSDVKVTLVLLSETLAAAWLTVTDAVALTDPLDAVIVAEPFATAVIVPPDTVATFVSLEDQFTVG